MTMTKLLTATAIAAVCFVVSGERWAFAESADGSESEVSSGVAPALAPGAVARFRVGYINSQTGVTPRSATVVTIANEGTTACTVSVDWRNGFSPTGPGGNVCTTSFVNLERGQSADLCSRSLPGSVTTCNAVCAPELTFNEGNAVVGSTNTATCAKITVSARVYYFGNTADTSIQGITDPTIAKFAVGNTGD